MSTPLFPVTIYPSQLVAFKDKANSLSTSISEILSIKKLSAFKRNDYLSIALGYKGHPDLIQSVKFRKEADTEQQLLIFSNEAIRQSISVVFSQKLPEITVNDILLVCEQLEKSELGTMVISDTQKMLEGALVDKSKKPTQNICPILFFDEWGNSPEAIKERQDAAKFLRNIEAKNTIKNSSPKIVINISKIPINILQLLNKHPSYQSFLGRVRQQNASLAILGQSDRTFKDKQKDDWNLKISLDTWGISDINDNLLEHWSNFKEWLMKFYATDRIYITERINDYRWKTPIIQFRAKNPLNQQFSKLSKNKDISLFLAFATSTDTHSGNYGHIFENEVAEIDINKLFIKNKNPIINLDSIKSKE